MLEGNEFKRGLNKMDVENHTCSKCKKFSRVNTLPPKVIDSGLCYECYFKDDSRYPFTYACDAIRSWAGYDKEGTKIDRFDASVIRDHIAKILNMTDFELAIKLADYYMAHEDEIAKKSIEDFQGAERL
jgi:hypothetical protein